MEFGHLIIAAKVVGINEIVVVGSGCRKFSANNILNNYIPNKIVMASAIENEEFPLLKGKACDLKTSNLSL